MNGADLGVLLAILSSILTFFSMNERMNTERDASRREARRNQAFSHENERETKKKCTFYQFDK